MCLIGCRLLFPSFPPPNSRCSNAPGKSWHSTPFPTPPRQPAELAQTEAFAQWNRFLKSAKPHVLNAKEGNPFSLPDLQKARVILIGEDHTMHYPAEQLVEYLIAYNKSAPQSQHITHLFVEFAYQANVAMEFIRAHMGELPEKEL